MSFWEPSLVPVWEPSLPQAAQSPTLLLFGDRSYESRIKKTSALKEKQWAAQISVRLLGQEKYWKSCSALKGEASLKILENTREVVTEQILDPFDSRPRKCSRAEGACGSPTAWFLSLQVQGSRWSCSSVQQSVLCQSTCSRFFLCTAPVCLTGWAGTLSCCKSKLGKVCENYKNKQPPAAGVRGFCLFSKANKFLHPLHTEIYKQILDQLPVQL